MNSSSEGICNASLIAKESGRVGDTEEGPDWKATNVGLTQGPGEAYVGMSLGKCR